MYRARDEDAARDALADFYDVAKAADIIPEADRLARGGKTPSLPTTEATD